MTGKLPYVLTFSMDLCATLNWAATYTCWSQMYSIYFVYQSNRSVCYWIEALHDVSMRRHFLARASILKYYKQYHIGNRLTITLYKTNISPNDVPNKWDEYCTINKSTALFGGIGVFSVVDEQSNFSDINKQSVRDSTLRRHTQWDLAFFMYFEEKSYIRNSTQI